jgi:AraC family transcriptional regulator
MNPVEKALWYIESHFADEISLDDVAGVSRFHLVRAFQAATGRPVMRHVRGRRLTEAARVLADGAPDIPRRCSGCRPRLSRGIHPGVSRSIWPPARGGPRATSTISNSWSRSKWRSPLLTTLEQPRFEQRKVLLIAGLGEHYNVESSKGIPALWQRFIPHIGNIPGQLGPVAYGVLCNFHDDGNFDYIAGVDVSDFSELPAEFSPVRIPEQRYAVFTHRDHMSAIQRTMHTICSKWLPESGLQTADGPNFERYDQRFDPATGTGGVEIWLAVKA